MIKLQWSVYLPEGFPFHQFDKEHQYRNKTLKAPDKRVMPLRINF